jgi:hypothetical protein
MGLSDNCTYKLCNHPDPGAGNHRASYHEDNTVHFMREDVGQEGFQLILKFRRSLDQDDTVNFTAFRLGQL